LANLEKFSRALRLRWLWCNWDKNGKPWRQLLKITDQADTDLFFSSTVVSIGDGKVTPFWEARWLMGASPKELAPNLYQANRFKHRCVHDELTNLNWIKSLGDIQSPSLLEEFTMMFMALSSVVLTQQKDVIQWRWTSNAQFLVASAYDYQFQGSYSQFPAEGIWKAATAPKCKFFA
jgi:hypothetical protein